MHEAQVVVIVVEQMCSASLTVIQDEQPQSSTGKKVWARAEGILKSHPWPCTALYSSSRQTLDLRIHLLYTPGSEHFGHIRRPDR